MSDDYPSKLMEPILSWPGGMLVGSNEDDVLKEEFVKLILLFEHFSISPTGRGSSLHLALALARKHVPGFQRVPLNTERRRKAGAPQKWKAQEEFELYQKVTEKALESNLSERSACLALTKPKSEYAGINVNTLHRRFMKAKKSPFVIALRAGCPEHEIRRHLSLSDVKELDVWVESGKCHPGVIDTIKEYNEFLAKYS